MYYEDPEPYYNTQYRILRGRDLTRRVVRRLKLQNVPEFNGTAAPPANAAGDRCVELAARLVGVLRPANRPSDRTARRPTRRPTNRALVGAFIGRVQRRAGAAAAGSSTSPSSRRIRSSRQLAANTLVDEYVDAEPRGEAAERRRTCSSGSTRSSSKQQQKVEESERALADYRDTRERDVARRQAEHRPRRG